MRILFLLLIFPVFGFALGPVGYESAPVQCLGAVVCNARFGLVFADGAMDLPGGVFCDKPGSLMLVLADVLGKPMFFHAGRTKAFDPSWCMKDTNEGRVRINSEDAERVDEFAIEAAKKALGNPGSHQWKNVERLAWDIIDKVHAAGRDKQPLNDFLKDFSACAKSKELKPEIDRLYGLNRSLKQLMWKMGGKNTAKPPSDGE